MKKETIVILLLRFSLGLFMIFAGMDKLLNPEWSAENFLLSAQTFSSFYAWFAHPENLVWVNSLNAWGITFIGLGLVFGVFTRYAAYAGAFLMLLYYFPQYVFPHVPYGYFIEEHIIYALVFILIAVSKESEKFSIFACLKRYNIWFVK